MFTFILIDTGLYRVFGTKNITIYTAQQKFSTDK